MWAHCQSLSNSYDVAWSPNSLALDVLDFKLQLLTKIKYITLTEKTRVDVRVSNRSSPY